MYRAVLLLIAAIAVVGLIGCKQEAPEADTPPVVGKQVKAPAPTPEPPPKLTFEWTENPTLDSVPDTPLAGVLNDKPFEANTIFITEDYDGNLRDIEISNLVLENDDDLLIDDDGVNISLATDVAPGLEVVKGMEDDFEGHVYYYYEQPNDGGPMSVNTPYGFALVLEKGESGEYDPDGEFTQITGSYTGKLAVCFDDADFSDEEPLSEDSYIAGTFEAKVRYWGPPTEPTDGDDTEDAASDDTTDAATDE